MQIGILYICTGNYHIFWKSFYESSEKFFLPGHEKRYYVFTDAKKIAYQSSEKIRKIYQANLGWPDNTLMRFEMFNTHRAELLENTDYVFFCNANLLFEDTVDERMLPEKEGLAALQHSCYWSLGQDQFPYDRNPQSTAYIEPGKGSVYFTGAFNGGRTKDFLTMSERLAENTKHDKENGIIALWHDESHLNKYLLTHDVKVLDPSYGYAESWDLPFKAKVLIRDKRKYATLNKLRGMKSVDSANGLQSRFNFIKKIFGG